MRNDFKLQTFRCNITPLSPLFIGCGEAYTPTDYVVDDGVLYNFRPESVPLTESLRHKLLDAAKSDSIAAVPAFFYANKQLFSAFAEHAVEVSNAVESTYLSMVQSRIDRNQNFIFKTMYRQLADGSVAPYIPGSGIKGVIRTSLLDRLSGTAVQYGKFEAKLLDGDFSNSPFRFLRIGDFLSQGAARMRVENCSRCRKAPENDGSFKRLMSKKCVFVLPAQYRLFQGEIQIQDAISECINPSKCYQSIEAIFSDLNRFYLARFEEASRQALYQSCRIQKQPWIKECRQLLMNLKSEMLSGRIALIRIGGNVGAENLTMRNGSARIVNRKTRKIMQNASTAWTASVGQDIMPFGWALLEVNPDADNTPLKNWCSRFYNEAKTADELMLKTRAHKAAYQELVQAEAKALAEQQQAEQEAQRAAEEAEAKMAALSPNLQKVERLVQDMNAQTAIKPGSELYGKVCALLTEAEKWHPDEQKYCAEQIGPLVKKKDMLQGKRAKEIKATLAKLREA